MLLVKKIISKPFSTKRSLWSSIRDAYRKIPKLESYEVPWWFSGLRVWCFHCWGMWWIAGHQTACHGHGQKKIALICIKNTHNCILMEDVNKLYSFLLQNSRSRDKFLNGNWWCDYLFITLSSIFTSVLYHMLWAWWLIRQISWVSNCSLYRRIGLWQNNINIKT